MLLLNFSVRNHKSIRDEVVFDLVRPSLRTLKPTEGAPWSNYVYPLAGVFGANASGKSALLDAFGYVFAAIRFSATSWQAHEIMPRAPFLLDDVSPTAPSAFELDFVLGERRYRYGFEVDDAGVSREWLRDVPSTRWRNLLDRDRSTGTLKLHPSLSALGPVTARELALSRADLLGHPQLSSIARHLIDSFDASSVAGTQRERRLASITDALLVGSLSFDDILTLLQMADIGVEDVAIREDTLPPELQEILARVAVAFDDDAAVIRDGRPPSVQERERSDAVVRSLLFTHRGIGTARPGFSIDSESDGTVAWLALAVPALESLRRGGLFCVDEIDSSLHPHLLEVLLGLFDNPEVNRHGAQLIFSSHDSYILSPLSDVHLEPEQTWFTDKSVEGVTELVCLADFPRHGDANIAKRYLAGRYGGVPRLAPSAIGRLLNSRAS